MGLEKRQDWPVYMETSVELLNSVHILTRRKQGALAQLSNRTQFSVVRPRKNRKQGTFRRERKKSALSYGGGSHPLCDPSRMTACVTHHRIKSQVTGILSLHLS